MLTVATLLLVAVSSAYVMPRPSVAVRFGSSRHSSEAAAHLYTMKLSDEEIEEKLAQLGQRRGRPKSEWMDEEPGTALDAGILQEIGLFAGALALFFVALFFSLR